MLFRGKRRGYRPYRPPASCTVNVAIDTYVDLCGIADRLGIASLRGVLEMLVKDVPEVRR